MLFFFPDRDHDIVGIKVSLGNFLSDTRGWPVSEQAMPIPMEF
jgi:hypothetical protein